MNGKKFLFFQKIKFPFLEKFPYMVIFFISFFGNKFGNNKGNMSILGNKFFIFIWNFPNRPIFSRTFTFYLPFIICIK